MFHGISFIWNTQKARTNLRKHGVSFENACESFFDPFLRVVDVSREEEERDAVIGMETQGRLLFVIHIQAEDDRIRLISARKATTRERLDYENQ